MSHKTGHVYEFGPFLLDTGQHQLSRDGHPVSLNPKMFDLLLILVESQGRLLLKQELMTAVWPDSFVEESNLTQQVAMLRRALGESAGEDRYIVTVPARGYRFNAEVKTCPRAGLTSENQVIFAPEGEPVPSQPGVAPRPRQARILVGVLCLVVAGLVISFVTLRHSLRPRQGEPRSLAILPFQNLKGDKDNDFLGFSLADAVIIKLGSLRSLAVRPSSAVEKYRRQAIDIQAVAKDLHVDTLLTGNFIRDGDDLRITSQLIDVATQAILWRGSYDLKYAKLLTVQDDVTREIVSGLRLSLSPSEIESLKPESHVDPQAYEYYLRGVDLYSRNEFPMAIRMLRKSAEIDPAYALTWAQLGRSLTASASFELGGREEYREAGAAYERALSLQPAQLDTRIYMANLLTDTGRVEQAVPLLRAAMKANPNHAELHWELGYAYRFSGMLRESVAECERARALDPGVKLYSSTMNGYLYLGQYQKFIESLPKDSDSALIVFYRGFGEYHLKHWDQAVLLFERSFQLRPSLLQAKVGKALSAGIRKQPAPGLEMLRDMERRIAERGVGDGEAMYKIAQAYAALGDTPSALRVLGTSIQNGFFSYPYFLADPLLEPIRRAGEFARLMSLARERHEAFRRTFL